MPPADNAQTASLEAVIGRSLDAHGHRDDPDVARLVTEILRRHGDRVTAVLMYGSYLRGKRDTLLDFYVLLSELRGALPRAWHAPANRALPPNVYYLALTDGIQDGMPSPAVRAKYATMTLHQFERAMGAFHSYFWSRFTQPSGLVCVGGCRDLDEHDARQRVVRAVARAVHTFVSRVAPTLRDGFSAAQLWQAGFALTYACELRSERTQGIGTLYANDAEHFDALLGAYAVRPDAAVVRMPDGGYRSRMSEPRGVRLAWALRRIQGKLLSVLRLVKAAGTFDDPLDYLLWKIERHSGIYIAPTQRQRRYPLIFAWGLLWRLYRRGAFR